MKTASRRLDLILLITVAGAFTLIASQRLATVPVPDLADEPFMLQTPYELLYEGKFAQGMYRFLGGNIQNAWHSLEPGCLLMLSGFFKVFGFGLLQARAFNLAAAAGILVIAFFIGRRMVDWRAGLAAVILLASDLTFLERSRMVRTDYAPALFGLLAFYLYEIAESRRDWRLYVVSGLAAGVGVLGHPNVLYVVAAIFLIMLLRHGLGVLKSKHLFQFGAALCVVLAYTVISCLVNYRELRLQYRDDDVHFWIFSGRIWLQNILAEPDRYKAWYSGAGLTFRNLPLTVPHLFQALAVLAVLYLAVRVLTRSHRLDDPRVRILIPTLCSVLFFALVSRKTIYYMVHIETWLALCAGILLVDAFGAIRRRCLDHARALYGGLVVGVSILLLAYGLTLARQTRRYLRDVRDPELASFEEFKGVIRSVVPEGVCPVAVKAPVIWLAFPESDRCFATIEKRMLASVDISGKEYALVTLEKGPESWTRALIADHHLIARLIDSPYGDLSIYYTGNNPDLLKLEPIGYRLFGRRSGHTTCQLAEKAPSIF